MSKGKVLVTGGAGFVGSHMCKKLIKEGYEVICFDNLSTGKKNNIANLDLKFIEGDCNTADLEKVFETEDIDYVFHYAAVVGVKRTLEDPIGVLEDIKGLQSILDLSVKHNVKKVMYASSSEVYGEPLELPEREDGLLNAKLPYAVTKLVGEKLMEAYYQKHNLKTCSLRFFNVYGPNQESSDYGFVVGIFINQALSNKDLTIFDTGLQTRDFVFIEDNIEVSYLAFLSDKTNGEAINIGRGAPATIIDLANEVIDITGADVKPIKVPNKRCDIRHRFPDITKMSELLNFRPKHSLKQGLIKTIEYYKNK
jgi:UDP-glucose 4-epimerase